VLCVVGFFVWKFTRKRMGDYDNSCVFSLALLRSQPRVDVQPQTRR
jgi:hypothetical protein